MRHGPGRNFVMFFSPSATEIPEGKSFDQLNCLTAQRFCCKPRASCRGHKLILGISEPFRGGREYAHFLICRHLTTHFLSAHAKTMN